MRIIFLLGFLLLLPPGSFAQLAGLWTVTEVRINDGSSTPVARWFQFFEDGQMLSGTGKEIELQGHWQLQQDSLYLLDKDGKSQLDEPFALRQENDQMYWSRNESGIKIQVSLTPSELIPMASWDHLYGDWQISEIWDLDSLVTDEMAPDRDLQLSIGLDQQFTLQNGWHGPGEHNGGWALPYSSLQLNYYDPEIAAESWIIYSVRKDQLVLQMVCSPLPIKKLIFRR